MNWYSNALSCTSHFLLTKAKHGPRANNKKTNKKQMNNQTIKNKTINNKTINNKTKNNNATNNKSIIRKKNKTVQFLLSKQEGDKVLAHNIARALIQNFSNISTDQDVLCETFHPLWSQTNMTIQHKLSIWTKVIEYFIFKLIQMHYNHSPIVLIGSNRIQKINYKSLVEKSQNVRSSVNLALDQMRFQKILKQKKQDLTSVEQLARFLVFLERKNNI